MRPKHGCKANQTQKCSQLNPLNPLLGVVCQPTPQIGRKNAADLKQRHENANIRRRKLLGLQIQAPIRHERAYEEVVNEVETGKVEVKGVAQSLNLIRTELVVRLAHHERRWRYAQRQKIRSS